jgi:hypothetical protein
VHPEQEWLPAHKGMANRNPTFSRSGPDAAPMSLSDRLLSEGLLSVVDACEAEGVRVSAKTAIRWALRGAHGARVESIRVGGRRLTSRAAIRRFIAAQQCEPAARQLVDARGADAVLAAHGLTRGGRR